MPSSHLNASHSFVVMILSVHSGAQREKIHKISFFYFQGTINVVGVDILVV